MKNLFLLPTDKPSRLIIHSTLLNEFRLLDKPIEDWKHKKNIYITNDEEIKLGEWVIYTKGIKIHCKKIDSKEDVELANIENSGVLKIILTTDQELIKNGIQPIPDEFLEWFVKNPSCESVEVKCYSKFNDGDFTDYKIIIPKEEPKKETLEDYDIKDNKIMLLEEDLECVNMYLDDLKLPRTDNKGNEYSIVGRIKILQQEQDKNKYSEEIIDILDNVRYWETCPDEYKVIIEKFIEQFKKNK
jgi:hypothetical protein